ncbi:hypothetical protein BKA66DRAFT_478835 [Pyrenochaeta sp. MPI-SDFR-AT-0127]|nr:hypothetical protein BKA66DRAFT_478835 [Pyrenochaeta sp. MPI-SDFR-AT-0127]
MIANKYHSKAELEKQIKIEEQRKTEEKLSRKAEDDTKPVEGQDRRKEGKVGRWINYALNSMFN